MISENTQKYQVWLKKKRVLILGTGKQIKLFGTWIGMGKTLEIGEVYAPNVLTPNTEAGSEEVINTYHLTEAELMEIADYNIRLWLELKENLRKFGLSSKIFAKE